MDFFRFLWITTKVKGQSPPQELEVGPRSEPYCLVLLIQQIFLWAALQRALLKSRSFNNYLKHLKNSRKLKSFRDYDRGGPS